MELIKKDIIIDRENQEIKYLDIFRDKYHSISFERVDELYKVIHKIPPFDKHLESYNDNSI